MKSPLPDFLRRALWRLAHWGHHLDFAWAMPLIARLPLRLAYALAHWRGRFNAWAGRDWRSMALGYRHIRQQSLAGYAMLAPTSDALERQQWCAQRFATEARDEFEACLLAAARVDQLHCRHEYVDGQPAHALPRARARGLVLLTPHFDSFVLGIAFAARDGARVHAMASAVTQDARVDVAVQKHFHAKYRGLERYLHGGKVLNMEEGLRPFYRILENREALVVLGDSPALPGGATMQVDFLGQRRELAAGALRLAQQSGSDLGGFICRMERPGHYVMQWCEPGPADDPETLRQIYAMFSDSITERPGLWWAVDLLTQMPITPATTTAPPPTDGTNDYTVLVLRDSPLQGSAELSYGLQQLQGIWPGAGTPASRWLSYDVHSAPSLDTVCAQIATRYLLVITDPALLGEPSLPSQLAAALVDETTICAVAQDASDAAGPWVPDYSTLVDFERYVARRGALPVCLMADSHALAHRPPKVYMLHLERLRRNMHSRSAAWADLPGILGAATVVAPRAYVHGYGDYQKGGRAEMLDMLPPTIERLLDIGGGEGGFANAFMCQRGGQAIVLEPTPQAAQGARKSGLEVWECGVEALEEMAYEPFDAISLLDVLEHLNDPLLALKTARKALRPGGFLLLSVPNIGHWPVVRDLAMGRFDYLPAGVLCITHLRFFTENSLRTMLAQAGFDIVQIRRHAPATTLEFENAVSALQAAGIPCDRDNLATLSFHVLAHAN